MMPRGMIPRDMMRRAFGLIGAHLVLASGAVDARSATASQGPDAE